MEVDTPTTALPSDTSSGKDDGTWHVTFDSTSALRQLLEALSSIFTRGVEFQLCRVPGSADEALLKVEAIDSSQVCIIKASLRCRVVRLAGEPTFTVDAGILNTCLRSVLPHYSLDIFSSAQSSDITLRLYETLSRTHVVKFHCATMVSSNQSIPPLEDIYYNYVLELEAATLKNCIRSARETQASDIKFSIKAPPASAGDSGKKHIVFVISAVGASVAQERVFHSIIDQQRGGASSTVIVTDHEEEVEWNAENLEEKYSGDFIIHFLAMYLKSIEKHLVTARMEPGKPLVLSYPLGSAHDCYIVLILAPIVVGE